jgi:thioredoxin-like negative regulator of GroEL
MIVIAYTSSKAKYRLNYLGIKTLYTILILLPLLWLYSCNLGEHPVSKEEATKVANELQNSFLQRNPDYANNILEINSFCKRIEKNTNIRLTREEKKSLAEGLKKRKLGTEIVNALGTEGSYRLLRQYEKEGKQHLLFRMYYDNGVNYYDYELIKIQGKVKVADIFIYTTGENMSSIVGKTIKNMSDNYNVKDIEAVKRIRKYITQKDYTSAMEAFESLPMTLKKEKIFMLMNIEITNGMDDNERYIVALEEYSRSYPNETNIPILMIDAYILNKDYSKALEAVNSLDNLVGKDPFLDYYRALLYNLLKDNKNHLASLEKLYQYDPEFGDGVVELIAAYIDDKAFDKARPVIAAYRENKNMNQELLDNYLAQKDNIPEDLK